MKTYREWYEQGILEHWRGTGLLEDIQEDRRLSISKLLESQKKFNDISLMDEQFKRTSIPLLVRIFSNSLMEGVMEQQPKWFTFNKITWPEGDIEAEKTAEIADRMIDQIRGMGRIAVHCLKMMDDGTIAVNYQNI